MIQPMCTEYLHPIYENDEIVGLDGAEDLWEFTEEYYNSLAWSRKAYENEPAGLTIRLFVECIKGFDTGNGFL